MYIALLQVSFSQKASCEDGATSVRPSLNRKRTKYFLNTLWFFPKHKQKMKGNKKVMNIDAFFLLPGNTPGRQVWIRCHCSWGIFCESTKFKWMSEKKGEIVKKEREDRNSILHPGASAASSSFMNSVNLCWDALLCLDRRNRRNKIIQQPARQQERTRQVVLFSYFTCFKIRWV